MRKASSRTDTAKGGLYHPSFEHESCGVGFVVDIEGRKSNQIVDQGLKVLENLEHRGASGSESSTGDGAGILVQIPHEFLKRNSEIDLPDSGLYATGIAFLPREPEETQSVIKRFAALAEEEGLQVAGWRYLPTNSKDLGTLAIEAMPAMRQVFLIDPSEGPKILTQMEIERRAYILRKRAEHDIEELYFPSLSTRTLVYKGMLTSGQLRGFFPDLSDPNFESAIALVHSRFSTNTFPSWPLAHPYRLLAHNGEINTLQGNRNWMRARQALISSEYLPGDLSRIAPICTPGVSDSAAFDEVLELLHLAGRSLPHAVLMMIPEAWQNNRFIDQERKAFYEFHASIMEPWDGPASIAFTDGTVIGAVLDRNGLRPSRYWVTDKGLVVMASEVGVLDINPESVTFKGRLQPGKMFLVDTSQGRIISDDELKSELAKELPYGQWLEDNLVHLEDLPPRHMLLPKHGSIVKLQRTFGYTTEELKILITPMAVNGIEPIGSMGSDTPLAVLSNRPRLLFDYFSQLFAQVTNPPLDAIREEMVTSLRVTLGAEGNLLVPQASSCSQIVLEYPIIDNDELAKLMYVSEAGASGNFKSFVIDGLYEVEQGGPGLERALDSICEKVLDEINTGANIIILSDRNSTNELAPIPSLLLTSAVHHFLIREQARTLAGLVIEAGDVREVHHCALVLGYGASCINPYLAFESIEDMISSGRLTGISDRQACRNYIKALSKGVLKVMSKMGISTVQSYTGAQVFEAIGLSRDVIEKYFTHTPSRIGGIGLETIAQEIRLRHRHAWHSSSSELAHRELEPGGEYQWRREGEFHLFNPQTVFKLQHSTRTKRFEIFKEYTRLVDDQSARLGTLRGLLKFESNQSRAIDIDEVEPISEIVKRFSTGAMSYGSISQEAHETLAIAMNRLGARSNTGEGGEDADRFTPDANGDLRRSAIKQVASGRFGVTSEYLVNADDIQIKIAQGAKPGEGGQLPGHKVYPWIAKTRYSIAGVGLISPPPHHDIYSIEDIAQLIHDLKNVNPQARIHVKLVAEVGVGTVAAGVAKAHSDVVLISGHDGGTGASPLTSLKHAGGPWELGLAETQQTLLANGLRDRIVVQVDGQLKTGRDVVIAALLGAEEFGFATAPLVVSGCVMMRVCHLDTCPVGIATQNPELRKKFQGKPEFVETFFEFIAQEVREYLAMLGIRSIQEAVGRSEYLAFNNAIDHWKASGIDLTPILDMPVPPDGCDLYQTKDQDHGLDRALDVELIKACQPALEYQEKVSIELPIRNTNRTVGAMLGGEISRRFGAQGLPDDTIEITFTGSAGQSFGAFLPRGVTLVLYGDTNDYCAKGLSGGRVIVRPPDEAKFLAEESIIAGNVCLYGATGGEAYLRGVVGERFAVRNSGALCVVEGVGDHGCEYMTGGRVVVLGKTGRNFGAGMSGGIAYVYDPNDELIHNLNLEMVEIDWMDDDDRDWLREVLTTHFAETDSPVAQRLLSKYRHQYTNFKKVMPKDYKRVLEAIRQANESGADLDSAIMAAAHG